MRPQAWLMLGEATFRYALAVMRSGKAPATTRVVATSFGDLGGKEKEANVQELQQRYGVDVRDNVDSTRLELSNLPGPFDRVFFMFPHGPKKGRVDLSRALLTETCRSVKSVLDVNGVFILALAKGQGGTAAEAERRTNAWNVADCAATGGLFLKELPRPWEVHEFGAAMTAFGYVPTGRRGNDSPFRIEGAMVHELVCAHRASQKLDYFPRDLSFFHAPELDLARVVECCNSVPDVFDCVVFDQFAFPDGRKSATLRMRFRGFLSWDDANVLQNTVLAQRLVQEFNVVVR